MFWNIILKIFLLYSVGTAVYFALPKPAGGIAVIACILAWPAYYLLRKVFRERKLKNESKRWMKEHEKERDETYKRYSTEYNPFVQEREKQNKINETLDDEALSQKALAGDEFACHSYVERKFHREWQNGQKNQAFLKEISPYIRLVLDKDFFFLEHYINSEINNVDDDVKANKDKNVISKANIAAKYAGTEMFMNRPSTGLSSSDSTFAQKAQAQYSRTVLLSAEYLVLNGKYQQARKYFKVYCIESSTMGLLEDYAKYLSWTSNNFDNDDEEKRYINRIYNSLECGTDHMFSEYIREINDEITAKFLTNVFSLLYRKLSSLSGLHYKQDDIDRIKAKIKIAEKYKKEFSESLDQSEFKNCCAGCKYLDWEDYWGGKLTCTAIEDKYVRPYNIATKCEKYERNNLSDDEINEKIRIFNAEED